jgi:hypothetical protein
MHLLGPSHRNLATHPTCVEDMGCPPRPHSVHSRAGWIGCRNVGLTWSQQHLYGFVCVVCVCGVRRVDLVRVKGSAKPLIRKTVQLSKPTNTFSDDGAYRKTVKNELELLQKCECGIRFSL